MTGTLTIFSVWDRQHPGYVALPRKNHSWTEKIFKYPDEKDKITEWIDSSIQEKYNIYWCPTVLENPKRIIESIPQMNVLYADLDEASPFNLPQDLTPTVAWQTSNGRYAAIWYLDGYIDSKIAEDLNKRLTYHIGADKGGWDLTQVLRIPGLPNYKYEPAQPGKLLWKVEKEYSPNHFRALPKVETITTGDDVDIEEVDMTVNEIVYKYMDKLSSRALKLLLTPKNELILSDRSTTLWELECMLVESGMSRNEVYTIAKHSIWNKYHGRKDEQRRLLSEVDKAFQHTEPKVAIKEITKRQVVSYAQLMGKSMEQPKWLIKDWWEAGSHGILAGEPKTYKSTVSTEIAVSVASGKPLFGKYEVVTPGAVIIIQEENSEWLMQDRLAKVSYSKDLMGSIKHHGKEIEIRSPEDLPIFMVNRSGINLTLEDDRDWIYELCKQIKPALIILDPIYLMFGDIDGNSAKELAGVLQWLITLSTTHNTAVMLVHHFNKGGTSSRGGQRMLGSVTFHAWVQCAIYNRVVEGKKNTVSVEREFRSFMAPDDLEISFDLGDPGELAYNVDISEKDMALSTVIETLLEQAPRTVQELSTDLSRSQKEIAPILTNLQRIGRVVRESNNKYRLEV